MKLVTVADLIEYRRRHEKLVDREITALSAAGPALATLDRHSAELNRISQEMRDLASATDLVRIGSCQQIVSNLRQYSAQTVYVERAPSE